MKQFTKIIATIGPRSESKNTIQKMYDEGMHVARLNFSHGTQAYFKKIIKRIRSVSEDIAILQDTKGPEIRSGDVMNDAIVLRDNQELEITSEEVMGTDKKITVHYPEFDKVEKDNIILIDDGLIEAKVIRKNGDSIIVRILNGGLLGSKKTVSILGHSMEIPFLSEDDMKDISFASQNHVSLLAASFVRTREDVKQLKAYLHKIKSDMKVISKIEHWQPLSDIKGIIQESDGIMVARGDLGVEVSLETVPRIQADIIRSCNALGKPVIVATQMLESMKDNPRPTRAEVSDVAQAILQGADAVMLSGETAIGKYPDKAVKTMRKIAREYDKRVMHTIPDIECEKDESIPLFIAHTAYDAYKTLKLKAIITPTETGFSARNVSRFKPKCPIYAFTPDLSVLRQLQLSWGIFPKLQDKKYNHVDDMTNDFVIQLYKDKLLKEEDRIGIAGGHKLCKSGSTNMFAVYQVKEVLERVKKNCARDH